MADSSQPTFASRTPVRIGAIELQVRDLEGLSRFYQDVVGLEEIGHEDGRVRLGAGGVAFLELNSRPEAIPDDPATAGLFHTAFLLPTRANLARWLTHATARRVPLTGASDHLVSEAIYLDDPEGNGIEVYADRPRETWTRQGTRVEIDTLRLDVENLLRAASDEAAWHGTPGGTRIGHVHLRVGDPAEAERFYGDGLGLDVTAQVPGATFLSWGGYHHHLGANAWRSRGAGPRDPARAGLGWVRFEATDEATSTALADRLEKGGIAVTHEGDELRFADPWGTELRLGSA